MLNDLLFSGVCAQQESSQSNNGSITPQFNTPVYSQLRDTPSLADSTPEMEVTAEGFAGISQAELTAIYKKSCSRRNFAARLVDRLFDEETRNVQT